MTMSVTCVFPHVGHFHSTPSPWGFVNRRKKVMGFLHTLQVGGVLVMLTSILSPNESGSASLWHHRREMGLWLRLALFKRGRLERAVPRAFLK